MTRADCSGMVVDDGATAVLARPVWRKGSLNLRKQLGVIGEPGAMTTQAIASRKEHVTI